MTLRRFLTRRRSLLKYAILFSFGTVLITVWRLSILSDATTYGWPFNPKNELFTHVSALTTSKTRSPDQAVCLEQGTFEISDHADIYTYDLPEVTNYTMITGKRFREYAIPVKSEEVAHGPDLDPLTVLLIPFSHVDPGYGRTMEEYYNSHTRNTLNNMVMKLEEYKDLTFQWAETVFLERWWRDIKPDVKAKVRKLIERGQLEIVLGGWVMPDEASTHYVSVIDQLVEGHQWVIENLETKPKNSWSNDPFGFSSTMPYLWKQTGMENMVILRIHQAIKGTLMKKRALELNWKQLWSRREENSIFCHLMPYRGYWIGDTCGPYNQHICREYAFMHTEAIHKVVFLTQANLAERARILYEQYRITSEIYRRHGIDRKEPGVQLFLPMYLGEDFSYTSAQDFDLVYQNYKLLFDYINNKTEWRMKFKFGTTAEYFNLVKAYQSTKSDNFKSVAGDFFPYSDYQEDYWTGYYTTRPFNKQLSRELQSLVRTADIFHSYAYAYSKSGNWEYSKFQTVSSALRDARRELGMFLHHDGITGTSVLHVIQDFQNRLSNSLVQTKTAIKDIVSQLLVKGKATTGETLVELNERKTRTDINRQVTLSINSKGKLIVVNPSSRSRKEVLTFLTSAPVRVRLSEKGQVVSNVQYEETGRGYEVAFNIDVLPFSINSYILETVSKDQVQTSMSFVSAASNSVTGQTITLENLYIRADFDKETGMLTRLTDRTGIEKTVVLEQDILAYRSARSGAYIFSPAGPATPYLQGKPSIKVVRGKVKSTIYVQYKGFEFTATLYNVTGVQAEGLHITTILDIRQIDPNNREVIMRFKTDIKSEERFFTDQNGFQFMGRKTFRDRPIEQNYYPITTMAMIEDSSRRLTLHTGQPHGAASLESGWLEVMLDRAMSHDDDKGLGQGVMDNVPTEARFVFQFEKFKNLVTNKEVRYTYPSERAIMMSDVTDNPLYSLFFVHPETMSENSKWDNSFRPISSSLPCDLDIVNLRTLVKSDLSYNSTSLIVHKKTSMCLSHVGSHPCDEAEDEVSFETLFPGARIQAVRETTLTHLHHKRSLTPKADVTPRSMELRAFTIDF